VSIRDSSQGERRSEPNLDALRVALAQEQARQHLTLEDLSTRTGLSRTSIWNLTNGEFVGKLLTWYALAQALDVPLCYFAQALELPMGQYMPPYHRS